MGVSGRVFPDPGGSVNWWASSSPVRTWTKDKTQEVGSVLFLAGEEGTRLLPSALLPFSLWTWTAFASLALRLSGPKFCSWLSWVSSLKAGKSTPYSKFLYAHTHTHLPLILCLNWPCHTHKSPIHESWISFLFSPQFQGEFIPTFETSCFLNN
jgi:hypothetical protein